MVKNKINRNLSYYICVIVLWRGSKFLHCFQIKLKVRSLKHILEILCLKELCYYVQLIMGSQGHLIEDQFLGIQPCCDHFFPISHSSVQYNLMVPADAEQGHKPYTETVKLTKEGCLLLLRVLKGAQS